MGETVLPHIKIFEETKMKYLIITIIAICSHILCYASLRKFTSSIIQGMEKGNKELAEMLSDMSKELWHTKKQRVIQLAELAGNKVLIPIMMMFVGILIMVMVPIVTNMF